MKFSRFTNCTFLICTNTCHSVTIATPDFPAETHTFEKGKTYFCNVSEDCEIVGFNRIYFEASNKDDLDFVNANFNTVEELVSIKDISSRKSKISTHTEEDLEEIEETPRALLIEWFKKLCVNNNIENIKRNGDTLTFMDEAKNDYPTFYYKSKQLFFKNIHINTGDETNNLVELFEKGTVDYYVSLLKNKMSL